MQIRVDSEQLEQIAQQLMERKEEFESLVQTMGSIIGTIPEAWEGKAPEAYIEQYAELQPTLDNVTELIDTIREQIIKAVEASNNLDQDIASKLGVG